MRAAFSGASRHRADLTAFCALVSAILASVLFLALPVHAEEYIFSADEVFSPDRALSDFIGGLDGELLGDAGELLPDASDASIGEELTEKLDLGLWIEKIADFAVGGIGEAAESILPLFSLVVLMAAANAILPEGDSMRRSFGEFASLLCAVEVFRLTSDVLGDACAYLSRLCGVMNLFVPVMESVCLISGRITEKAVSGGGLILFSTLIGNFASVVLMPTVSLLFTFTAVVGACPDSHLGGVLSGVRKFIGRLWSVFGILFSFLLSVQTLLAGAADSLGARTARFALASFVPVAGGMIAEALSTLRGGMAYVRQTAGVGGILVLLALFLPTVIPMVLVKLALSLTESAAGIMGVGAASSMLGEVRGIAELIIGVVTGASLVFLITLMMFMKVWSG